GRAASSAAEPPPARKRNCRLLVTVIERLPRELVLMLLARRLADDVRYRRKYASRARVAGRPTMGAERERPLSRWKRAGHQAWRGRRDAHKQILPRMMPMARPAVGAHGVVKRDGQQARHACRRRTPVHLGSPLRRSRPPHSRR